MATEDNLKEQSSREKPQEDIYSEENLNCDIQFDDNRSFTEELHQHQQKSVFGFTYGEEVAKKTEQNIQNYHKVFIKTHISKEEENGFSPEKERTPIHHNEENEEINASTSKQILDHKTPHTEKLSGSKLQDSKKSRNFSSLLEGGYGGDVWSSPKQRNVPLPLLPWANSVEVWQTMVYKEEATARTRNCRLFEDPSSFLPRMRSILIDWVMEVCEVYHLRRVTYYLAVDYVDRFLTIKPNVPKSQLQLIGISSLFIAAKLEEVYPPKLAELSYVCDGACSDQDILDCELLLLNTLGWDVNPMTPTGWLNLYMQLNFYSNKVDYKTVLSAHNQDFFFPQYSAYQFIRCSYLIDLFSLDPGFLLFNYSVIAAGAIYFLFGRKVALDVSGLSWSELKDCVEYMAVFYGVVRDCQDPKLQSVTEYNPDDKASTSYVANQYKISKATLKENHTIQTHVVGLKYFETATIHRLQRMGLQVRKTLLRKKKITATDEEDVNDSYVEEDEWELENGSESENCDSSKVLFKIEKLPSILVNEIDDIVSSSIAMQDHEIDYFTAKSRYTFDEILLGINTCTSRTLLPNRVTDDVQNNDSSDE